MFFFYQVCLTFKIIKMKKATLNATDLLLIGLVCLASLALHQRVVAPMIAPKK